MPDDGQQDIRDFTAYFDNIDFKSSGLPWLEMHH
jgi:hypothetical protein